MPKELWVCACMFMREKGSYWENGVAIGRSPGAHDIDVIVDSYGVPLQMPPWDYKLKEYKGAMIVNCT